MTKYFLGWVKGWELFKSAETPTEETHGAKYTCVWGPFVTKRGALWAQAHPYSLCATVREVERAAKNG